MAVSTDATDIHDANEVAIGCPLSPEIKTRGFAVDLLEALE